MPYISRHTATRRIFTVLRRVVCDRFLKPQHKPSLPAPIDHPQLHRVDPVTLKCKGFPDAAARRPKSPCTSNKIFSALRARIFDMSSERGVVRAVATSLDFSCRGFCEPVDQSACDKQWHQAALTHRKELKKSPLFSNIECGQRTWTYFVEIFVCHQREAKLRATSNHASGASFVEGAEALLSIYREQSF
jgi:hypothetical protein